MTTRSNLGLYNSGTYYPFTCDISAITKAMHCVVTTTIDHAFVVGNEVQFSVPSIYGMVEINNLKGYVLAVTSTTITLGLNTLYFSTFSVPVVGATVVIDPAQVIPIGDGNTGTLDEHGYPVTTQNLQIPGTFYNTFP